MGVVELLCLLFRGRPSTSSSCWACNVGLLVGGVVSLESPASPGVFFLHLADSDGMDELGRVHVPLEAVVHSLAAGSNQIRHKLDQLRVLWEPVSDWLLLGLADCEALHEIAQLANIVVLDSQEGAQQAPCQCQVPVAYPKPFHCGLIVVEVVVHRGLV